MRIKSVSPGQTGTRYIYRFIERFFKHHHLFNWDIATVVVSMKKKKKNGQECILTTTTPEIPEYLWISREMILSKFKKKKL